MKAMVLKKLGSFDDNPDPLDLVDWPRPSPAPHEVLIEVSCCGVCHTELDEIEGRTPPPRLPVIPGHEVIGRVVEAGEDATRHQIGARVGVGWIHSSDGSCEENLSDAFEATGRDVHGGYAAFMTVHEDYACPVPDTFDDAEAAPLLCAGAVGYRSLMLANLKDGQPLGLTGFGGSGHLVLQLARHLYPNSDIAVFARDPAARDFALELGAVWAGATQDRSPSQLAAIIDTTPAWTPVVAALPNLAPGGRLVINAIRKEDNDKQALLELSYHEHLWMEREIKTVANVTHFDIAKFLPLAAEVPIKPRVETYPLADANKALRELKQGPVRGAKVLTVNG